jgi:NADH:ubiquinone oxidoreductase subunit E
MESNMTNPKTARDCLAHCRDVLTDKQMTTAVDQIEKYAVAREREAVIECLSAIQRATGGNLFAGPMK